MKGFVIDQMYYFLTINGMAQLGSIREDKPTDFAYYIYTSFLQKMLMATNDTNSKMSSCLKGNENKKTKTSI